MSQLPKAIKSPDLEPGIARWLARQAHFRSCHANGHWGCDGGDIMDPGCCLERTASGERTCPECQTEHSAGLDHQKYKNDRMTTHFLFVNGYTKNGKPAGVRKRMEAKKAEVEESLRKLEMELRNLKK